jgi:hypothetical protein
MTIYKCTGLTEWDTPCDCEYREVSDGEWEYRYQGTEPGHREWTPISAKSIADIEDLGHRIRKEED